MSILERQIQKERYDVMHIFFQIILKSDVNFYSVLARAGGGGGGDGGSP